MHEALRLFPELSNDDMAWILKEATENQVISDTTIIHEGENQAPVAILLEGLVGVELSALKNQQVAKLGPGEILGEGSFVSGGPAAATLKTIARSRLLVLPRETLEVKLASDSGFASRFYRACAAVAARRLRERVNGIGQYFNGGSTQAGTFSDAWLLMSTDVEALKEMLKQADKEALRNQDCVPAELSEEIERGFSQFVLNINDQLNPQSASGSKLNASARREIGARLQREILPYLLLTRTAERMYSKPRGFAGDYITIDWIYQNDPQGTSRLGSLLDRSFLSLPASQAVRNRREVLAEYITITVEQTKERAARVTSMACGPAAEIFDAFDDLDDPTRLNATLIDIDSQALAFVNDKAKSRNLQSQIEVVNGNLVNLAAGKQELNIEPQDLVYSIGFIDYFSDEFVIMLLNYIHNVLRPGGRVVLGNFHPQNPDRAFMEHVLDWKLIHRSEADMHRLFMASAFARPCTNISFEDTRINLFAECIKSS